MKMIHFKQDDPISGKGGVRIKRLTPALKRILDGMEAVMLRYSWVPELVITSINDGRHMTNSRHYTDEAVDIRSKNFHTLTDKMLFKAALQDELGSQFTVLLEYLDNINEHFHVQVRKGTTFP